MKQKKARQKDITLYLTYDVIDKLKKEADRQCRSPSNLARISILDYLKRKNK